MKSRQFIIIGVIVISVISIWNFIELQFLDEKAKVMYVDNHKLFDEFQMTKEYDQIIQKNYLPKEKVLDSLKFELQVLEKSINSQADTSVQNIQRFYKKRNYFLELKEEIEKEKSQFVSQTKSKIWNRLNELMMQYGEEKEITLILGASGNGNIMYGSESLDITEDVIHFVNSKYQNAEN